MSKLSRNGFLKLIPIAGLALLPMPVLAKGHKPRKKVKKAKKPKKPRKSPKKTRLTSRLQCGNNRCGK